MILLKQFALAFAAFLVLDFVWLGFVMKDFNTRQLAQIGRIVDGKFAILYGPAILVYLLMAVAVVGYVLPQLNPDNATTEAMIKGGILGLIIYGVFDFTNLAILKNYPLPFVIADIGWGVVVFGLVSLIVVKLT